MLNLILLFNCFISYVIIWYILSIVDIDPIHRAIDTLITEFMSKSKELSMQAETLVKLGEVLTKAIRNLGELVPHFASKLLNVFLNGCKHSDELVRASCLSNLGETCKLLNFALNDCINELISCLSSIIDTDKCVNVKRSASMVLQMIIEGLNKETFIQVLGPSIVSLFKLLTKIKSNSQDDIIQVHCQMTSDYLNEMIKKSMFPIQSFRKEIKILNS